MIGWWGVRSDGALATPFTAIVIIFLIWKSYFDYHRHKSLEEKVNNILSIIQTINNQNNTDD